MTEILKDNKIKIVIVVVAALILYSLAGKSHHGAMERTYSGDVLAKVNGEKIREEEFRERLDYITGGKGASINLSDIDEKGMEALAKEVYVQRLVLDAAIKSGVENDPELKNKIASLVNTIYKEKFLENIAKKDITDEKIKTTYDELVAKAKVSKQYRVKHILFKTEEEAKAAREKILSGNATFEDVAKLDSLDKPSAAKGGDLGSIFPDEFVPEFAAAVKKANIGEISQPVKTEFGWHLIKVEGSKPAEIVSFEDAKPRIEKQLGSDAVKKFVDGLTKDLKIEIVKKPTSSSDSKGQLTKPADTNAVVAPSNSGAATDAAAAKSEKKK